MAAVLLAAERLRRRGRAGCGHVRDHEQGRHLRAASPLAVVLRRASRTSAGFGSEVLLFGGMATIAFGAIGVLASRRLTPCGLLGAGFLGTLLASITRRLDTAGALFYLVSSTLTMGAFFLLIELVERGQEAAANVFAVTTEAYDERDEADEEEEDVGIAFPGTIAALGISFAACGILLAGLPPLSGFVAKFAILSAMLNPEGLERTGRSRRYRGGL